LRRIDLLITVGEILRETFEKRGVRRSCVVGNWKDPTKFKFSPDALEKEKRRLHISNGQLVISFIANLGKERQIEPLVEAVKDTPGMTLIVGGDGPCRGIVQEAAESYPNIIYLGYVHPSKVPFYTAISDIVFYGFDPSNPNSRFSAPNKLFEALAAGKAVLTGDFGEIGGIVRKTECGLILKAFSEQDIKMSFSKVTPEVLNRLKENASRAGLVEFNWKYAASTLLLHYNFLAPG
jgi:glycosyltransferase involved in cell wall biosynthesis